MKAVLLGGFLVAGMAMAGCDLTGDQSQRFAVSDSTANALERISSHLHAAGAELEFHCSARGYCSASIDGSRWPKLQAELLEHPRGDGSYIAFRVHGGTQELQRALYQSLGEHSATVDFAGRFDEREAIFEHGQFKIRCVASRQAIKQYECWTIVGASLLK